MLRFFGAAGRRRTWKPSSAGARSARARRAGGRRGARGRRRRLPGHVPQSAGVARHPRRVGRRGARRGARHFFFAGRVRHPGASPSPAASPRSALVYIIGSRLRGHDPLLTLVLAGVVIGTLLGSAIALIKYLADPYNQLPGDHVLAARQPRRHHAARPRRRGAARAARARAAAAAALAHEPADAAATTRRGRSASTRALRARRGRGGDADDRRGGVGQRHHRLDRAADSARRAPAGRARISARLLPLAMLLGAAFLLGGGHAVPHDRHASKCRSAC